MKKIFGASVVVVAIGAVIYLVGYGNDAVNENQSGTDTTAVTEEQTTEDGNGGLNEEPLPGDDIGETDDAGAKSEAIVVKMILKKQKSM